MKCKPRGFSPGRLDITSLENVGRVLAKEEPSRDDGVDDGDDHHPLVHQQPETDIEVRDGETNGDALDPHLELAPLGGGQQLVLRCCDAPNGYEGKLTSGDDDSYPSPDPADLNKGEERTDDEDFVRRHVDERSIFGDGPIASGQVSIEHVCEAGYGENHERDPLPVRMHDEVPHGCRQRDTDVDQDVWYVHDPLLEVEGTAA